MINQLRQTRKTTKEDIDALTNERDDLKSRVALLQTEVARYGHNCVVVRPTHQLLCQVSTTDPKFYGRLAKCNPTHKRLASLSRSRSRLGSASGSFTQRLFQAGERVVRETEGNNDKRNRSQDVLELISKILGFSDDQKEAVGWNVLAGPATIITSIFTAVVGKQAPPANLEVHFSLSFIFVMGVC